VGGGIQEARLVAGRTSQAETAKYNITRGTETDDAQWLESATVSPQHDEYCGVYRT